MDPNSLGILEGGAGEQGRELGRLLESCSPASARVIAFSSSNLQEQCNLYILKLLDGSFAKIFVDVDIYPDCPNFKKYFLKAHLKFPTGIFEGVIGFTVT